MNNKDVKVKDNLRKCIMDMIDKIQDENDLRRINRFVQFIYTKK